MAATIQTIQTPKRARALDTSGNNNHGQIYSGRALEFDGVTDYFQHNGGTALAGVNSFADNVDWTLAYWINFTTDSSLTYMVGNDGNTSPCFILHVDDNLSFRADDGDIYDFSSDKINYGTWYRMVLIAESNTVKLYLNGVQYGSTITTSTARTSGSAGSGTFPGSGFEMTGWGMPYGIPRNHGIDGHMSDGQVWDAAWTADDITFDYLNPEQLALNRGGTSLTESNLKLWYPMQDGHRGQQSFILDGSNTGLGDEMVAVNDLKGYTSIPTGWSTDNTDGTHTVTWDSRGARFYAEATGTIIYLKHTAQVVEGQTYKLEVVISNYGGDSGIKIDSARTSGPITFTSNGTHTKYVTAAASGQLVSFYRNGINVDLVIESVSLKPINAKNHATTVFYGEEMITNGDMELDANWANNSTPEVNERSAVDKYSGSYSRHIVDSTPNYAGIKSDTFTTVTGTTYKISCWYKNVGTAPIRLSWTSGDASLYSNTINLTADSWTQYTTYYTETTGGSGARVNFINSSNTNSAEFYIDDVSIKEVGTATGWTDADQQLDIPQTALQSYNQLAWFTGDVQNKVTMGNFTPGEYTTVSFWYFKNDPDGENTGAWDSIRYSDSGGDPACNFRITINGTNKVRVGRMVANNDENGNISTGKSILRGEWNHIVVSVPRDDDDYGSFYINGEEEQFQADGAMVCASRPILVGYGGGLTNEFMNGTITEVAVYSDKLTDAEALELYNDGIPKDAREVGDNLIRYHRNNGLATWKDLSSSDEDGVLNALDETLLIPAGVDGSRDNQGFIMNRQRTTNALNSPYNVVGGDRGAYVDLKEETTIAAGTAFSITLWVKPQYADNNKFLGSGNDYIRFRNTTALRLRANGVVNDFALDDSATWTLDDWVHVGMIRNTSNLVTMYIDGDAQSDTKTVDEAFDYRYIGAFDPDGSKFSGGIDDVCIYNGKELSPAEVKRNYNAGKRSHRNG